MAVATLPRHMTSGSADDNFTVKYEIERRYVITSLPKDLESYPHKELYQAYVQDAGTGKWIRVRREGPGCYILNLKEGEGVRKREAEKPIHREKFYDMVERAGGRVLRKTRYLIPYNEYVIELDVYHGKLRGLVTAEVEFDSMKEFDGFKPPAWFGKEVTYDKRYHGRKLAKYGIPEDEAEKAASVLRK